MQLNLFLSLSARSSPFAPRFTLCALRWNFETLEHWNFRNRSLIPYGEKDLVYITTSIVLHPLTGKWKDLLPFASRSTLNKQSSAL